MSSTFSPLALGLSIALSAISAHSTPITSPLDPALANAVVVGFETVAPSGFYTELIIGNMTIRPDYGTMTVDNNGIGHWLPTTNYIANFTSGSFTFTFARDVLAFGLLIGDTNAGQTLTAFDNLNNVIEVINIPDQVGTLPLPYQGFYGIDAQTAIINRVVLSANSKDIWILDNVTFVVPEPETFWLFGLAFIGMLSTLKLRRRGLP